MHAVGAVVENPNVVVSMLLARHGETPDNAHGLILGRHDPSLSPVGRDNPRGSRRRVAADALAAIWCSPLLRARQTAAVVAEAIGVEPTVLEDLIESDRGSWEGRPVDGTRRRLPELFAALRGRRARLRVPRGESIAHQVERTRRALNVVAAGPTPALVVAHAGRSAPR